MIREYFQLLNYRRNQFYHFRQQLRFLKERRVR